MGDLRPSRRTAWALALCLPTLGAVELGLSLWFARRTPREADFVAARPRLLALRREVDGAAVAPRWLEPVARMALGEEVLPLGDVARPDESRFARMLQISARGATLPELSSFRVVRREDLGGGLVATIFENPSPARPTFDFTAAVAAGQADVAWVLPDGRAPCAWRTGIATAAPGLFGHPAMPRDRYVCGRAAWQSVGVTVHDDERHLARRCVWSHPPEGGHVSLVFRDVQLGRELRGHQSIHWTLERDRPGTPVVLSLRVDGVEVGRDVHRDGEGWRPFSLPLGELAGRRAREVELRIESERADQRHVCWEADTR